MAKTVKDYVQPLVVLALSGIALSGTLATVEATRRSAFLLGILYFVLNLLAATASRNAHRFDQIDRQRVPWLWILVAFIVGLLALGSVLQGRVPFATAIAVTGFALLVFIENVWRPLFLDRLDDVANSRFGAAVLSVEAQFSSLGVMVCAPLIGKCADHFGLAGIGGFVVVLATLPATISYRRKRDAILSQ